MQWMHIQRVQTALCVISCCHTKDKGKTEKERKKPPSPPKLAMKSMLKSLPLSKFLPCTDYLDKHMPNLEDKLHFDQV